MTASAPALIAVDWGSSSFRAYLIARDGAVLDAIASADGVSSVAQSAFPDVLRRLVGSWLDAHARAADRRLGHGRQPARLARGALCEMPGRSARHRREFRRGPGGRPCRSSRARPFLRGRHWRAGRHARRGGRDPRHFGFGRTADRSARLPFEMGDRRTRPGRALQDIRDRRIVRGNQGSYARRRLRSRRQGESGRGGLRAGRQARRGGRRRVRAARRSFRGPQPAADGQARPGRRGRNIFPASSSARRSSKLGVSFPTRNRMSRERNRWSSVIWPRSKPWGKRPAPRRPAPQRAGSSSSPDKPDFCHDSTCPDPADRHPSGRETQ